MVERHSMQPPISSHGGWDTLLASVDALARRRPSLLASDRCTSVAPRLLSHTECGLCTVPIYRVIDQPSTLAQATAQLVQPVHGKTPVPPVKLYKIGDSYFIHQSKQAVEQARSRGDLFLQARVTECSIDRPGNIDQLMQLLIDHERSEFLQYYPVPANHPFVECQPANLGSFAALSQHISKIQSLRQRPTTEPCAALFWYDHFYAPVLRLLHCRRMQMLLDYNELDLYLWAAQHTRTSATDGALQTWPRQIRRMITALWVVTQHR